PGQCFGLLPQRLFSPLALGDVKDRHLEGALTIPEDLTYLGVQPDGRAIFAQCLVFLLPREASALLARLHVARQPGPISRRKARQERAHLSSCIRALISQNRGIRLVGKEGDEIAVNDDTLTRTFDEVAEASVTLPLGTLLVSQGRS